LKRKLHCEICFKYSVCYRKLINNKVHANKGHFAEQPYKLIKQNFDSLQLIAFISLIVSFINPIKFAQSINGNIYPMAD